MNFGDSLPIFAAALAFGAGHDGKWWPIFATPTPVRTRGFEPIETMRHGT